MKIILAALAALALSLGIEGQTHAGNITCADAKGGDSANCVTYVATEACTDKDGVETCYVVWTVAPVVVP